MRRSPRLVEHKAVLCPVKASILAHKPCGDPTPSAADVTVTAELARAGALLDIELVDHLIIGDSRWVSLRRLGLGFTPATT